MRRLLSLTLSLVFCCSGFGALGALPARAQEVASFGNLDTLRRQYEQLLAVERNVATPPEVRELNRTFLEERRAQLAAAIRNRIGALDKYRAAVAATLSDAERRTIDDSTARLSAELRALLPEAVPASSNGARRTRRPARAAAQPAPAVEASFDATAPAAAEPTPAEPAASEPAAPTSTKAAAPIEIVSPERDRVVHTGEVELEVNVRDDAIDDLMVAVYTPASEKPKTARVLNVKRSDHGSKSVVVALSRGDNRVEVSDLKRGEVKAERNITFQPPEVSALGAAPRAARALKHDDADDEDAAKKKAEDEAAAKDATLLKVLRDESGEYDWGRVRGYFTGGVVFSKENDNFSKSDVALSFVLDKNYIRSRRWNLNTFFEARLTAVPVAAASPTPTPAEGATTANARRNAAAAQDEAQPGEIDSFITSRKAGLAQVGVYAPINVNHWMHDGGMNSIFVAPLAKGGIQTIVGEADTNEAKLFGNDDVFNFFSVGFRFGHYRYPRPPRDKRCIKANYDSYVTEREDRAKARREARNGPDTPGTHHREKWDDWDYDDTRDCEEPWDYAPELISWLDLTTGRWENFQVMTNVMDAPGHIVTISRRPWRYQAEGRLKIPGSPFLVGFDGNFGEGKDDVRFGFGMRFDVGKLLQKLKAVQEFDALDKAMPPTHSDTQKSSENGSNPDAPKP
ncbi:MAG: hypothetical protein JOZ02_03695 [Acidobacteria bacterium]|nr:hypothetical protein [Acidobacteriota bacterium]